MMRLVSTVLGIGIVTAAVSGLIYGYFPGLRVPIERFITERVGWTEEARQQDPVGYLTFVMRRLEKDLADLTAARKELLSQIAHISRKIHEQEAFFYHAQRLAHMFRSEYQLAQRSNNFPMVVHGATYSAEEATHQIALLLAEAAGYRESVDRLRGVREEAERQLQTITVRLNRTEAEIAALSAERQICQVREIVNRQGELLARVQSLFDDNKKILMSHPVRTVRELLAAAESHPKPQTPWEDVEAFLAGTSEEQAQVGDTTSAGAVLPTERNAPALEQTSSEAERVQARDAHANTGNDNVPAEGENPPQDQPDTPHPGTPQPGAALDRPSSQICPPSAPDESSADVPITPTPVPDIGDQDVVLEEFTDHCPTGYQTPDSSDLNSPEPNAAVHVPPVSSRRDFPRHEEQAVAPNPQVHIQASSSSAHQPTTTQAELQRRGADSKPHGKRQPVRPKVSQAQF